MCRLRHLMTIRTDRYLRTLPGRRLSRTHPGPARINRGPKSERDTGGRRFLPGHDRFSYSFFKLSARGRPPRFRVVVPAPIPFGDAGENQLPATGGMRAMELRQLTTESERRIFGERMEEARAKRGAGFRETRRSSLGKIHLEYGLLYGLFEHDDDLPEEMMSGFADARSRQLPAKLSAAGLEPSAAAVGDRGRRAVVFRQGRRSAGAVRLDDSGGR